MARWDIIKSRSLLIPFCSRVLFVLYLILSLFILSSSVYYDSCKLINIPHCYFFLYVFFILLLRGNVVTDTIGFFFFIRLGYKVTNIRVPHTFFMFTLAFFFYLFIQIQMMRNAFCTHKKSQENCKRYEICICICIELNVAGFSFSWFF